MIKAGYALEVTSWENDGDYYNTKRIDGLGFEECAWLVQFCKEFKKLRQVELDYDVRVELYNDITTKVGYTYTFNTVDDMRGPEALAEFISEIEYKLLGYAYESDYSRVLESYKVFFFKENVKEILFS